MTSLVDMSPDEAAQFSKRPLVARHSLANHALFTDEALATLLDEFPRDNLYALSMGQDPLRSEENQLAVHDGLSGRDLLRAVKNGRLWLNVTRVDRADAQYKALLEVIYAEVVRKVPGFKPLKVQGTLLISSPQALVYYHADGPANALWHIRGRKRLWLYPALDERFMAQPVLEDIFAGVRQEYLPYQLDFDQHATVFDLEPGQWASWPQNSPHRVTNLDGVNVSLSTEHFTLEGRERARIYTANHFLRSRLGLQKLATDTKGPIAFGKMALSAAVRRLRLLPVHNKRQVPTLRVVPDAPLGVRPLSAAEPND
jgi:hypothetical protein